MGLILWIDHNTFATTLFEKIFKNRGIPFYTIPNVEDFSYLIDDLNPVLIVVDFETYLKNPPSFKKQYLESIRMRGIPFVIVDEKEDLQFIENKLATIQRPINAFELPDLINKILSSQ